MYKKKISIFDFIWIIIAGILFGLRYVKIINVDYGIFGSTYITFVQKISNCSLPIVNTLKTCQNIDIINFVWLLVIGIFIVIQLMVLIKKFKK